MRSNFERKSTPYRHQLLSELARTNLADYPGIRQYVAALDTFFNKLAKLNHVVLDRDKLFHLQQCLTEEFKRGILGKHLGIRVPIYRCASRLRNVAGMGGHECKCQSTL